MSLFHNMNISGSALTANRLRMDVVSSNIANANSTRDRLIDGEWIPYQRKIVQLQPNTTGSFAPLLQHVMGRENGQTEGVLVSRIKEDRTPFKLVYDPNHPDANSDGYVRLPNVDIAKEMVDMTSATRAYEANVTTLQASKNMFSKALEIGK